MKIVIKIDENSNTSTETFGMIGKDCINTLDKIIGDLLEVDVEEKKEDFFKGKINNVERNELING